MAQHKVTAVGVAGATGKFAGLVFDSLVENPDIKIRGLCRNASKLATRYAQSSQLEIIEGDVLDHSTLARFVSGLDVVICAYLGDKNLMINAQKALIDACDEARVPRSRYIASDYTFDYTKLELGQHPVKDPMKIVHEYLKGKQHVQGVHVLVGALMETFWSGFFGVWNSAEKTLCYWGSGEETWESTTYGDAAKFTAAVALDPGAVGVQKFLGDKKNTRELAAAIKHAYGFEPRLQRQGSLEELYTQMQDRFEEDPANVYAWLASFYQYYLLNGQTYISGDLGNEKYPHVQPQTFQEFLNTHALDELPGAMEAIGKREK